MEHIGKTATKCVPYLYARVFDCKQRPFGIAQAICSRRHRACVGFKVQTITDKVRIKPVCKSERAWLDVVFDVYFCLCGKKSELIF